MRKLTLRVSNDPANNNIASIYNMRSEARVVSARVGIPHRPFLLFLYAHHLPWTLPRSFPLPSAHSEFYVGLTNGDYRAFVFV